MTAVDSRRLYGFYSTTPKRAVDLGPSLSEADNFIAELDGLRENQTRLAELEAEDAAAREAFAAAVGFYSCPCGSGFEFAEDSTLEEYAGLNRWLGRHVPCGAGGGGVVTTYIAGPMSGHPQFNYPAFAYVATVLRAKGVDVRSPHEVDAGGTDRTWHWYMREALKMMLGCDEILLLPGWRESPGACLERHVAEALGMKVSEWQGSTA